MAKYKIMPSSRTIVQSPISIGHKAEKGVEAIEFDLTAWVETYGSGTLTVIMRRWGDAIPYPIALEIDENNKATWTLSDIDTAKAGMAYAQLNYIVGDEVVKKSDIYTFRVMDSLTGEGEPPEAYESWLEHLTHLAAEAMAEVLDIEGIVTDKTLTVDGGIADAKATGDALALKADKSTTYTKAEVDQMIEDVEVETDTTLSVSGAPADAAETGRQIGLLKADLGDLDETINGSSSKNYIEGKNLSATATAYTVIDDEGSCISEDIPITWTWQVNDYVKFYYNDETNVDYQIWFLNSNKTPIKYYGRNTVPNTSRSVKMPADSAYIRFSFKTGTIGKLDNAQSSPVVYWTAGETIGEIGLIQKIGDLDGLDTEEKESLVGAINEVIESIPSLPDKIAPKDTTFFVSGVNLVNPDTCVSGQYVNQANGNFASNSTHKRTGYVPVEPSESYFIVSATNAALDTRYAFYKSDKTFISGGLIAASQGLQVITSPANAAYMVASVGTTANNIMIAQTDTVIPFEPYALYIDKQYINLGSEIVLNVPAKIYAVVGYELNIYFENITEDWTKYDWNVDCTVGKQMERGYTITPTASDVGTKTLTIKATDEHGNVKTVISSLIITSASAGSGSSKSVIVLGDSTTNSGIAVTKLNENFADDVMNLSTLGTRGTAPNLHEGRSGWRLETYFTTEYVDYTDGRGHVENPFYNPTSQTFDASYYFANSGVSVPDFFVVNMGINDVFGSANDTAIATAIDQFVDYMDAIITSLRTVSQTLKICICCTIPPNHSQDAFGKAYGCNQTRNRCKRNNLLLVERLIDEYDGRESEGIYLIPIHTNLDTVYNMGLETLPVNARNTDVTYQSPISNGGVHPVASGYWQIADVYTAFLKANA